MSVQMFQLAFVGHIVFVPVRTINFISVKPKNSILFRWFLFTFRLIIMPGLSIPFSVHIHRYIHKYMYTYVCGVLVMIQNLIKILFNQNIKFVYQLAKFAHIEF
jgi:hypothetical protein